MIRVFPVASSGKPHYFDDWHQPRNGHLHQGNDLFATEGTPVLMPDDGVVSYYADPLGGPSFTAKFNDGSRAYGTHLSAYEGVPLGADTRGAPRAAQAGEVIGYVGRGGNAAGTPAHLHFQYWLPDGSIVDPYPYLRAAELRDAPSAGSASKNMLWVVPLAGAVLLGAAGVFYLTRHPLRGRRYGYL